MLKRLKKVNWSVVIFTVINSIVLAVIFDFSPTLKLVPEVNVTYQDLAATLLTAAGLLNTVFGVGLTIAALFGYKHIKGSAENMAVEHVKELLKKAQDGKEDSELRKAIIGAAEREAAQTAEKAISMIKLGTLLPRDWGNEDSEYGDSR